MLAVEGYRSGALTAEQLHRMLSLRTKLDVAAFLKARGIHPKEDLHNDLETLEQLHQQ